MNALFPSVSRRRLASWRRPRQIRQSVTLFALLVLFPALALAQSGTPFDTGFTNLQTLFTGTIAKVASLIAIVIGGYQFAHGEPGAKKTIPTAASPSESCSRSAIFSSGLSTIYCWSLQPRRSLRMMRSLCARPVPVSIVPSAPATTRCSLQKSEPTSPIHAAIRNATRGQGRSTHQADRCGQAEARSDQHGIRPAERRQHGNPAQQVRRNPAGQTAAQE